MSGCTDDRCVTCGDVATPMLVLRIDEARGLALCVDERSGEHTTVEVALIDAQVGDVVLVHAGTALA